MTIDKKTKIISTIGPASETKETLRKMILEGVNVCRLNFSHGNYEAHQKVVKNVREINDEEGIATALLADLQGPKIRIGNIENEPAVLKDGEPFVLTTNECEGDAKKAYINYHLLPKDVSEGELILLDDGKLMLEVVKTNRKDRVETVVKHGGKLLSHKGVNLPNTKISMPCLTEKDLKDLEFALEQKVDWIGLSFVRSAEDIIKLRKIIKTHKSKARIIAKIEKPEAVESFDEILKETDAVMVARGDLGVEIPMEKVPMLQKEIVKKCLFAAKPVIIATQMMESMIENISPTRAEVNDVANAVLDGADAVMLSAETSTGKHPIDVIKAMASIVKQVETSPTLYNKEFQPDYEKERFITDSICYNACRLSKSVNAAAIITMTHSGYTAYKISSFRPKSNIYIFTENKRIFTQLSLVWGVSVFYYDKLVSTDETIDDIKRILKEKDRLKSKDLVINIASMPIMEKGQSNMLKLSFADEK